MGKHKSYKKIVKKTKTCKECRDCREPCDPCRGKKCVTTKRVTTKCVSEFKCCVNYDTDLCCQRPQYRCCPYWPRKHCCELYTIYQQSLAEQRKALLQARQPAVCTSCNNNNFRPSRITRRWYV